MQYFIADDTIELLHKCSVEWYVDRLFKEKCMKTFSFSNFMHFY